MSLYIEYQTQAVLLDKLQQLYPTQVILSNTRVPGLESNGKVDFFFPSLNLIVMMDLDKQYRRSNSIIKTQKQDAAFVASEKTVVHIPYFIQWSSDVVYNLFGITKEIIQDYPHGFLEGMDYPSDFCELGITKFLNEMNNTFVYCKPAIIQSLKDRAAVFGNNRVVPPSLTSLLV